MTPEQDAVLQSVADAADQAMTAAGWLPVKTVVIAEVLADPEARRSVLISTSADIQAQDTLGLLVYALAREKAHVADEDD